MKTDIGAVAAMYNACADYEHARLQVTPIHEMEFLLTADALDAHVGRGARVLDLGAGTGVYSRYLMDTKDCAVSLVDLSETELAIFRKERGEDPRVEAIRVGSATDLSGFDAASFDCVLVFGPLYHLVDAEERAAVYRGAERVLKPGGLMFCAYIIPHRTYRDILRDGLALLLDDAYLGELEKGITYHSCAGVRAPQYRCWPSRAQAEVAAGGFDVVGTRSLEGIYSYMDKDQFVHWKDSRVKERIVAILKKTCENPDLLGATLHFLVTARKA